MPTLVVFAKAPLAGLAKTRLTPPLSTDQAHAAYVAMLQATLARARHWPVARRVLAFAPDGARAAFQDFGREIDEWVPQGEGELGTRLSRVASRLWESESQPLIFIGADSPDLPDSIVAAATQSLAAGRCAVAPAADGGYCLVAVLAGALALFDGIPWSSNAVLERTVLAAEKSGYRMDLLASWEDVDRVEDLHRLSRRIAGSDDLALSELHARLVSQGLLSATIPTR